MPQNKYTYDKDVDYMRLMQEAAAAGDFAAAAQYERQRNAKIAGEGLKYAPTHDYAQYLPENRYRFDPGEDAAYAAAKQDMDRAFRALTEGGDFHYDPDSDPVYQAYAARYLRAGRNAMEDTLGRAAALTGGYGSTYAEGAAQQAYDAYLQRLNDVLPDLYGDALYEVLNERFARIDGSALTALEPGIVGVRCVDASFHTNVMGVVILPDAIGEGSVYVFDETKWTDDSWTKAASWKKVDGATRTAAVSNDSWPCNANDIAILPFYNRAGDSFMRHRTSRLAASTPA